MYAPKKDRLTLLGPLAAGVGSRFVSFALTFAFLTCAHAQ